MAHPIVLYDLQAEDIGKERVKLSSRRGKLITDDEDGLPQAVRDELGEEFVSCETKGDGGCGLHAIWGWPHVGSGLTCPDGQQVGRNMVSNLLPQNFHKASLNCRSALVHGAP